MATPFVLLLLADLFGIIYAGADRIPPFITPAGYNASLNGVAVEFTCMLPHDIYTFGWTVDGVSAAQIGQAVLAARGITYDNTVITEANRTFTVITIEPRAENIDITLGCIAVILGSVPLESSEVVFRVQDVLAPPTGLEIEHFNSTHDNLTWTGPYSLDLTDSLDITGYTVTVTMQAPPPRYPYDLSLTLDQLPATTNQTFTISGHTPYFTFPRYSFPVWLRVGALNPVGLGDLSLPFRYTATDDCNRLGDVVLSEGPESDVIFSESSPAPTVELSLTLALDVGVDYCVDSVVVRVWAGDEGGVGSGGSGDGDDSYVLVPILSGTDLRLVLESELLESDTHYTASLSLSPHTVISTKFSTYTVQAITVTILANGVRVECVFGEGSTQDWCTVVLVLDGVEARREEDFTGEWTFSGLSPGLYTVLGYDPQPDTVASGYDPEPAVETEVEVTGETVGPSSPSPPSPSPTSESDTEPTVTDGIDDDGGNRRAITGKNLWIVLGVALLCVLMVGLVILIVIMKRVRHRLASSSYQVQDMESKQQKSTPRASNPLSVGDGMEDSNDRFPSHTPAAPTVTLTPVEASLESPYEVMDAEGAKENARRAREKKKEAARRAAAAVEKERVFSVEELKEIRGHTYSVVVKKSKASSPPPALPQKHFVYEEDFPEDAGGQSPPTVSASAPNIKEQVESSQLYDSLATSSHQNPDQAPPPPLPAKSTANKSADPVYESITGISPNPPPSTSSPPNPDHSNSPSFMDEREDSQLIQPTPSPPLPPRSNHVASSRHSMIETGATPQSGALPTDLSQAAGLMRPQSMFIAHDPSDPDPSSMGRRMSSVPLLTQSSLQTDV